jgi:hypothetical protein
MPKMPLIVLPSSEIIRSTLPKIDGIYPPATEPITIPDIIIFFRDIVAHFNGKVRKRTLTKIVAPIAEIFLSRLAQRK